MTVESYRSSVPFTGAPNGHNSGAVWFLANFISGSSSWKIIDSWKTCTYQAPPAQNTIGFRYKGDPIAHGDWATWADVGTGGGFVAEMQNPRSGYPPMQIVIQQAGAPGTLGCISGHSYKHDNFVTPSAWFGGIAFRVGTQGDWDFDNTRPDFADPTKASNTKKQSWSDFGAGSSADLLLVADDDWLVMMIHRLDLHELSSMIWWGQYNAKSAAQESVSNPCYAIVSDTDGDSSPLRPALVLDGTFNYFLKNTPSAYEQMGCLDENGVWQDWAYQCNPAMDEFLMGYTQPNEFDSSVGVDLFEILVRGIKAVGPGPDDRIIGSLRGIYWGYGLGTGAKFDSGNYMCTGPAFCVITEWDNGPTL